MAGNNFFWTKSSPYLLSILRIVVAFLFMAHGGNKLLGFPGGEHLTLISPDKLMTLAPGLAGILELGGGFLILVGWFMRPIAFILSGEMAFAYFMAHFPASHIFPFLNGGESAVLYCFTFLYLSAAGAGPLSVDHARGRA